MALTFRAMFRSINYVHNITKPVKCGFGKAYPIRILSSGIYQNYYIQRPVIKLSGICTSTIPSRLYATQSEQNSGPKKPDEQKTGLIHKFKQMYRDYWYVLLPVHMVTSAVWFGSFYYTVRR